MKEKRSQRRDIGFLIGFILTALIFALYLEIYRNTLLGWGLAVAVFAVFFFLRRKWLADQRWYKKLVSWCLLAALLLGVVVVSKPPHKQLPAVDAAHPKVTDVVTVAQGDLTGVCTEDGAVEVYAGIPYAKPPLGELRWKEPEEPESWEGIRVCDTFAPMSMQKETDPFYSAGYQIIGYNNYKISPWDNYREAMSEDSLYLNIWKPTDMKEGERLPVLFYVHGGSLNSGQSYFADYNGETLAKRGIIVVTITYRLGVFGYLASDELAEESPNHTTGNYGLLDQMQALRWVHENIAAFGGDADNITIAGESAGASSVNAICVSPLAKGLFRRAVAESSGLTPVVPYHTFRTMEEAKEVGQSILEEFSCASVDELRKIPAEELVYTQGQNNEMTVDGYAITEQPYLTYEKGENNEEAVLGGYNANEAEVFLMFSNNVTLDTYGDYLTRQVVSEPYLDELQALYPASSDEEAKTQYNKLMGPTWFGYSHYRWSQLMEAEGRPAYLYYFNKENGALGTWHAGELPYFYGNLFRNAKNYDEADEKLSEAMQQYLVNFVKTGDPNGEGLPVWKTFHEEPLQIMSLGENLGMIEEQYLPLFALLNNYMESLK